LLAFPAALSLSPSPRQKGGENQHRKGREGRKEGRKKEEEEEEEEEVEEESRVHGDPTNFHL
jgi:ribosomal protein L12E/L44/L45/RPP1/RPP2